MAEEKAGATKTMDPMDPWRGMRDAYLDAWSKTMIETVNSEAYAQASGALLGNYLTISTPFREAVEKTMLKMLEQLSMPSRNDVIAVAERLTNVEMKLDDLDSKLDRIAAAVEKAGQRAASATASAHDNSDSNAKKSAPRK